MKNNTNYLTGIRGFACLIVVIAHMIAGIPEIGKNVAGCGKIGVWLFFILSAFLLTFPWLKKEQLKGKDVVGFYIKRIFRIYPCYLVTLIVAFLIGYIPDIQTVVKHLILIEGMGHLWTIPVEFKFYLLVPLLILIMKKLQSEKRAILFLSILFVLSAVLFPYTKCEGNSIQLRWYIPVFLMGMLFAFYYKKVEEKAKRKIIYDISFFAIIILMILTTPYFRNLIFKIEPDYYLSNKYLYFGIAWSILIVCIHHSKYVIHYFNQSKILEGIGKISFPLYLIHYIVLGQMKGDTIGIKLLAIGVSIVLAIGMHLLVERPMIQLAKKINQKIIKEKEEKKDGKIQKNRNFDRRCVHH